MDDRDDTEKPRKAGSIRRISVENFMCHSSLTIELGDRVNFITGQNGSGKSAILTALCVAFGIKAKGTQRANSLKDFIKNGCSYGLIVVELNNVGDDAFKPQLFGDIIRVERRILDSGTSTFSLKDSQGRKIGTKKDDILEVVDHFNIDVENPCVIMTQDKSRQFLHGGNEKEKFKFVYRATLLQPLSETLAAWAENLVTCERVVDGLSESLIPSKNELRQIEEQIKTVQELEVLKVDVEKLKKIYAWVTVKEGEAALHDAEMKLADLRGRIPICQKKIDDAQLKVDLKNEALAEKIAFIARLTTNTEDLRQSQRTLKSALDEANGEKFQADEDTKSLRRSLQETKNRLTKFENDISEMQQRMLQDTQAELNEKLEEIQNLEIDKKKAEEEYRRLQDQENSMNLELEAFNQQRVALNKEIQDNKVQIRELRSHITGLRSQRKNTVTAFGGEGVLRLLRAIEENCNKFSRPPLGPLGAHVALRDGDWSLAVEVAVGRMLNDFVVHNQKDTLLLRDIGNRVGNRYLGIITSSFDRPPIRPTPDDLPDSSLLTVLGSLQADNPIIMNVLIDQGGVDRKVLVQDYNTGKNVAFNGGTRNVKEVFTKDGTTMYTRAGAESTLFPSRRLRGGRLGVRVDEQITQAENQERELNSFIQEAENRKRKFDQDFQTCRERVENVKRRRTNGERSVREKEFILRDLTNAVSLSEPDLNQESRILELEEETSKIREEIESKEEKLHKSEIKLESAKAKWAAAKNKFEELIDSTRGDFESLNAAEQELVNLEGELQEAIDLVNHWRKIMEQKVTLSIQNQETIIESTRREVEKRRVEASEICPESERDALGEDLRTRDQLSHLINRLEERVKRQRDESEPEEKLTKKANKIRRKISFRERWYNNLGEKVKILKDTSVKRQKDYERRRRSIRQELTWGFNTHLGKKGFSGSVNVNWDNQTLSMSVQMPQDASNQLVRDTRALSGGERSYSTLAFALAVHQMTEAPFRAMDEFDVFMDAVSRKISLDTVVDFALEEGSQWIFITPHDISMVKGSDHVKKQQMSAPRP